MHKIETLTPSVRSDVRSAIYYVLAHSARSGNHGPLDIVPLFGMAAERLSEKGIIIKPPQFRGQSLVQLAGSSNLFPNYGIDDSIADLMRQTFWELYLQGILAPAPKKKAHRPQVMSFLDLDSVMLTPYGVDILTDAGNRIQVHDPDGYLANFRNASPPLDPEMMRYLSECASVFRGGHLLASVVLLGIASERLIEVLAASLRDALGDPRGTTWFQSKYSNRRDISARFKVLSGKLMDEYGEALDRQKLKDAFQRVATLTFEEIRLARNDIAHPTDRQFTWNEVSGFLHSFVQYFGYVNRIIAFLSSNPKGR